MSFKLYPFFLSARAGTHALQILRFRGEVAIRLPSFEASYKPSWDGTLSPKSAL